MSRYETRYVKNLASGEPLILEVPEEDLGRMEQKIALIRNGATSPFLRSVEDVTRNHEFSFLPSYKEVLKIFIQDGFTIELLTQILQDFGLTSLDVERLISNENFTARIRPLFRGVTQDGDRASRVLMVVYSEVLELR